MMRSCFFASLVPVLLLVLVKNSSAFVSPSSTRKIISTVTIATLHALPSPEESAKALSDYMAKAHEEKLKAIKDAEAKKQTEIEALKQQVEALKATSGGGAIVTTMNYIAPAGSLDELQTKLSSYQSFIANYIVESQEQKRIAVQQAIAAVTKSYEEKLLSLATTGTPPSVATTNTAAITNELYSSRNAKVSAAAAAGKSRWGDMESQRAAQDMDQRLTLTEQSAAADNKHVVSQQAISFQRRNENVATAGKASRWGPMEVEKAAGKKITPIASSTTSTATIAPSLALKTRAMASPDVIAAADHGLRSDGGVGGLTLAERLANGALETRPTVTVTAERKIFQLRNIKIAAAGTASRWGPMEVEKAIQVAAKPMITGSIPPVVPAEVVAADHGLRNDGGVGGPTLAERVNLGALLMGKK